MTLMHERLEILVVDFLLLIGKVEEGVVHLVKLLGVKLVAEFLKTMLQRRMAAARGEHNLGLGLRRPLPGR